MNAAKSGDIVGPIRSPRGYNIIKVNDSRVTAKAEQDAKPVPVEVYAKQALLKLEPNASTKEVQVSLDIARQISKQPNDCKSKDLVGVQNLEQSGITVSYLRSRLDQLPDYARERLSALGVGEVGEPLRHTRRHPLLPALRTHRTPRQRSRTRRRPAQRTLRPQTRP